VQLTVAKYGHSRLAADMPNPLPDSCLISGIPVDACSSGPWTPGGGDDGHAVSLAWRALCALDFAAYAPWRMGRTITREGPPTGAAALPDGVVG
jgi:hypothetical protein